jgi:hypothetical protein
MPILPFFSKGIWLWDPEAKENAPGYAHFIVPLAFFSITPIQ